MTKRTYTQPLIGPEGEAPGQVREGKSWLCRAVLLTEGDERIDINKTITHLYREY